MSNLDEMLLPPPLPPMTEAERAKDRDFARRIDELTVLWRNFTPPPKLQKGAR